MTEVWQELRQTITDKLGDLLGTYSFKTLTNTVTCPALHIFPPQLPQDRQVSGLEILINRSPTKYEQFPLSGGDLARSRSFVLFLIQHDPLGSTETAVKRLLSLYPQAKVTELPSSDRAREQTKLEIKEFPKRKKRVFL
jgi:hypothetical protein